VGWEDGAVWGQENAFLYALLWLLMSYSSLGDNWAAFPALFH